MLDERMITWQNVGAGALDIAPIGTVIFNRQDKNYSYFIKTEDLNMEGGLWKSYDPRGDSYITILNSTFTFRGKSIFTPLWVLHLDTPLTRNLQKPGNPIRTVL